MASRVAKTFGSVAVLAALSACLPPHSASPPRPIVPQDGPRGTVSVEVFGGAFSRQIQPRFRLEKPGYALVAHLGGDGRIQVLYPETPRSSGWVSGGRTIRLKARSAMWDVNPRFYSHATTPYRNFSAQLESYDGLGHGYVFLITSHNAIDYGALMGDKGFDQFSIEDYEQSEDPRYAIREFADEITNGQYAIRFARNQSGGLYAASTGCPTHWGLWSYGAFVPWWIMGYSLLPHPGSSLIQSLAFSRYHSMQSCRGSQYALGRLYIPTITTVTVPVPGTPTTPITPQLQRPRRRTLDDADRTRILTAGSGDRSGGRSGENLSPRRPIGGGDRFGNRDRTTLSDRVRESNRSRPTTTDVSRGRESASRPTETPRLNTPSSTPQTTTTTSTGGETRAERPRPNQ
jgi:hypothetical protein